MQCLRSGGHQREPECCQLMVQHPPPSLGIAVLPPVFLSGFRCCVSGSSARSEPSPLLVSQVGFCSSKAALNSPASKKKKKLLLGSDPCRIVFRLEMSPSGPAHRIEVKRDGGSLDGGCALCLQEEGLSPRRDFAMA